jgi:phospholipid/cholesterol/gamma-HCH transport system ATP-binding protein
MDDADDIVIRFEGVVKSFGSRKVLDRLDLEVRRGETLAIMGPSGTGKSVMLRHAIGLMQPDAGKVIVDGHDLSTISRDELALLRRRMGYLFQEGALINWMNVGDNIALPLRENTDKDEDEIRELVEEKLSMVHLDEVWEKMPSEISGGMRKRVGLARALVTDPEIVLYDEPNAGLDPETSMSTNRLIKELSDALDITSIVVTHLVSCVRTVADRVVLLEKGRIVFSAPPEEFVSADNPRVKSFLGAHAD